MNKDEWKKWKDWYRKSLREWKDRYRKSQQEWRQKYRDWKEKTRLDKDRELKSPHPPLPPMPPIPPIHSVSGSRANVVASRIGDEELQLIDMLIEAGVFSTRSETVAYLVSEGIKARQDVFDKVSSGLQEIRGIRRKAEDHIRRLKKEIGLAESEDTETSNGNTCSACSKDLSGLPENIAVCPYCGTRLEKR